MASPTSAKDWKRSSVGEEKVLPSGNTALIKRPGMESLFAAGVLPDELTKMALEQISAAERPGMPQDRKKKAEDVTLDSKMIEKFMQSENAIGDIFEAFDKVTSMCVVEPRCEFHKRRVVDEQGQQVTDEKDRAIWEVIPDNERDHENIVYTDEVDLDDKTFIFNFVVGGSRDIATFREEFGDALATVPSIEDVELPPEPVAQPQQ